MQISFSHKATREKARRLGGIARKRSWRLWLCLALKGDRKHILASVVGDAPDRDLSSAFPFGDLCKSLSHVTQYKYLPGFVEQLKPEVVDQNP